MQTSGLKPGQTAPVAGVYQQIGSRGGKGSVRAVEEGEMLPTSCKRGTTYSLVERAPDSGNALPQGADPEFPRFAKKGRLMVDVDIINSRVKLYDLMDELD